ncbi:MAG: L,D-transpeptidase family protein [Luteibaculaceae bacterium]
MHFFKSSFLLIPVLFISLSCKKFAHQKEINKALAVQLEAISDTTNLEPSDKFYQPDLIAQLYTKGGELLSQKWSDRANIDQLLAFLRAVHLEGLNAEDYHLRQIEFLMDRIVDEEYADPNDLANLELLLTDSYLLLASHLGEGKTNAETIDPKWHALSRRGSVDWATFVDSTLKYRAVGEALSSLTPKHKEYENLKKALNKYLTIQESGGWEPFTTSLKKMEKGTSHPDVFELRKRLAITQGDVAFDSINRYLFDEELTAQVKLFQRRNGLTDDGVVSKGTLEILNVSLEERIETIRANLERWRWLSEDLGTRYINVNIANFELQLIEDNQVIFKTEAIVGKPYRETPVFSSRMTYLVFNPDWTVPPTILRNDVIPAVAKDPNYLKQKRMVVLTTSGKPVDPATIDWKSFKGRGFPYMIRQEPGPDNALGLVKFMFPNQHNVYIHDTPSRELFRKTERIFSSGCIRINQPMKLAEILLEKNGGWDAQRINQTVGSKQSRTVNLAEPIPVHLLYLTAWADDQGVVHFRRDVYNRDKVLIEALKKISNIPLLEPTV